ncbi:MAG: hypothetical protein IT372_09385 [Polyangiaceae bacterium]|nr:hypothetical protein [Polyangiaceae bacterium]
MRAPSLVVSLGVALGLLTLGGTAAALSQYGPAFPNGTTGTEACIYCHPAGAGGGDRNPFGTAIENGYTPSNLAAFWPDNCSQDADGDGATNGEEVGDPCCEWTMGATPQEGIASNPGDPVDTQTTVCAGSTSSSSSSGGTGTGTGSTGGGLADPPPPISQGACSVDGPLGGQGDAWGWAAAGLAALAGMRRRRP